VIDSPAVAHEGGLVHLAAICRDAAILVAVMPLCLQGVWEQATRQEAALVATRPRPAVVHAALRATEVAVFAGVGCLNPRRSLLVTLTRVVVVAAARGVVARVGVYRLWRKSMHVVLRWWILPVMRLSRRIVHSRPSRKGSARTKQISSWNARFARRTTTLASARNSEGLSHPFLIAELPPTG